MKANSSSLYRQLEILHLWCLETFENAPKSPAVQADIKILMENVIRAQSAVAMALTTESLEQRLDLLDVVIMSMTNVKSITKVLTEYSGSCENIRQKRETEEVNSSKKRDFHVISKKSRIRLLELMTQIGSELGSWRNKTKSRIRDEKSRNTSE